MSFLKKLQTTLNINSIKQEISRGAKRKTEKTAVEYSHHFINIAKEREDVVILPNEYYPPWLFDMPRDRLFNDLPTYNYLAMTGQALHPDINNVRELLLKIKYESKAKVLEHKTEGKFTKWDDRQKEDDAFMIEVADERPFKVNEDFNSDDEWDDDDLYD